MSLRGQPRTVEVMTRLLSVWNRIDDLSFIRLMANVIAAGGYPADQLNDIFFMGRIDDIELLRCIAAYEQILEKSGT